MKTLVLTFMGFLLVSAASAQRNVDLKVDVLSPENGSEIHPMQTFTTEIQIKNVGTETLTASDSLAVYLIMNDDTIPQMNGNYWLYTGIALAPQETYTIEKMMAFDNSFLGAHVNMCIYVKPFNAVDPVQDNVPANNVSCTEIDVVEGVNATDEILKPLVKVYPNPVADMLFLDGEVTAVTLTDERGKAVVSTRGNTSEISCGRLPNGVYLAKISTKQGDFVQKIVVVH